MNFEFIILKNTEVVSSYQDDLSKALEEYNNLTNDKAKLEIHHLEEVLETPVIVGTSNGNKLNKRMVYYPILKLCQVYSNNEKCFESKDDIETIVHYNNLSIYQIKKTL